MPAAAQGLAMFSRRCSASTAPTSSSRSASYAPATDQPLAALREVPPTQSPATMAREPSTTCRLWQVVHTLSSQLQQTGGRFTVGADEGRQGACLACTGWGAAGRPQGGATLQCPAPSCLEGPHDRVCLAAGKGVQAEQADHALTDVQRAQHGGGQPQPDVARVHDEHALVGREGGERRGPCKVWCDPVRAQCLFTSGMQASGPMAPLEHARRRNGAGSHRCKSLSTRLPTCSTTTPGSAARRYISLRPSRRPARHTSRAATAPEAATEASEKASRYSRVSCSDCRR